MVSRTGAGRGRSAGCLEQVPAAGPWQGVQNRCRRRALGRVSKSQGHKQARGGNAPGEASACSALGWTVGTQEVLAAFGHHRHLVYLEDVFPSCVLFSLSFVGLK